MYAHWAVRTVYRQQRDRAARLCAEFCIYYSTRQSSSILSFVRPTDEHETRRICLLCRWNQESTRSCSLSVSCMYTVVCRSYCTVSIECTSTFCAFAEGLVVVRREYRTVRVRTRQRVVYVCFTHGHARIPGIIADEHTSIRTNDAMSDWDLSFCDY